MNNKVREISRIGSYKDEDVTFLLKDISDCVEEYTIEERYLGEHAGRHYSETIPKEEIPSDEYMKIFYDMMELNSEKVATLVGVLSKRILNEIGSNIVLVSLLRAGTPIGVLVKRYIGAYEKIEVRHYSISIIRGKGVDENALKYIIENNPGKDLVFIDGWTGKGMITKELEKYIKEFNRKYNTNIKNTLGVIADPAYSVKLYATREDILIPNACLNSIISGLLSRSVHNNKIIGKGDFHGVKYYKEYEECDLTNYYVDEVSNKFDRYKIEDEFKRINSIDTKEHMPDWRGWGLVSRYLSYNGLKDLNLVKPSVGEATRVLLRRVPKKIIVRDKDDINVRHILRLAKEKNVPVEVNKDMTYSCCGIIDNVLD